MNRRRLLLHDGLSFLILTLITLVLFACTLFLFRSFSTHRADLSERWAGRGKLALAQGRPEEAVAALRTALEYAPGDRTNELMLAQAFSASGHTDQAISYFLNLWETQPGDGTINLQLARLERRKHDQQAAIHYYRAAIFGTWEGDGVVRRRDVRLELANYLIEVKDFATAQTELLIAATNAPPEPGLEIGFGDRLLEAHDRQDALRYYQKAIALQPRNHEALLRAGSLAFQMGDYPAARRWLQRAQHDSPLAPADPTQSLLEQTDRLLALSPNGASSERGRIDRILTDAAIAQRRLNACAHQTQTSQPPAPQASTSLSALATQWLNLQPTLKRSQLAAGESSQETAISLIDTTEITTAHLCGPPTGQDALLLLLATSSHGQEP